MNRCTFCGRQHTCDTKVVGGYTILEVCGDCEFEIENPEEAHDVDRFDDVILSVEWVRG